MTGKALRMRWAIVPAGALMLVLGSGSLGFGQTPFFPFVEDFETPFDDDPVTWVPATVTDNQGNQVTTQLDEVPGGLAISNPAQLDPLAGGPPFSLGLAYAFKENLPVIDDNARARAELQLSDEQTVGSIFFRGQDVQPAGDGGAYFANISGAGVILMGDFFDPSTYQTLSTKLDPMASPVVLEFEVVGNRLTAAAWDAAESRPPLPPSVSFTAEEARPLGLMGITVGRFGEDPTLAEATFYNYEVIRVPEPATEILLVLACFSLVPMANFFRRR